MFGLGIGEILVILVIALLVLGPRKLPEVARQVARVMHEVRRAAADFQRTLDDASQAEHEKQRPFIAQSANAPPLNEGTEPLKPTMAAPPGSISQEGANEAALQPQDGSESATHHESQSTPPEPPNKSVS